MVAVIGYRPLIESHGEWQKRKDCVSFGDRVSAPSSIDGFFCSWVTWRISPLGKWFTSGKPKEIGVSSYVS